MRAVRGPRLRTGATRWGLFRDGADPVRFVEVYLVPTWAEHLRQHEGRLTGDDEQAEKRADRAGRGSARGDVTCSGGAFAIRPDVSVFFPH